MSGLTPRVPLKFGDNPKAVAQSASMSVRSEAPRSLLRRLWGSVLVLALLLPGGAHADETSPVDARGSSARDRSDKVRSYGRTDPLLPLRVDGHAALDWEGGLGLGARADFVLIAGTFRYSARDELAISVGTDLTFINFDGSNAIRGYPTVALQWSLGIDERFSFFTELGLVGRIERDGWKGMHPNFGFGTRYYLRRSFGLQARFGWPVALGAGVVF